MIKNAKKCLKTHKSIQKRLKPHSRAHHMNKDPMNKERMNKEQSLPNCPFTTVPADLNLSLGSFLAKQAANYTV